MSRHYDTPDHGEEEDYGQEEHGQEEGFFEGEEEQLDNSECRITDEDLDQIAVILF
jgi:hypothetical protein